MYMQIYRQIKCKSIVKYPYLPLLKTLTENSLLNIFIILTKRSQNMLQRLYITRFTIHNLVLPFKIVCHKHVVIT